jgi:O-antigen ligase
MAACSSFDRHPARIGLLLASSLCLLPFLIPYHQAPLLSFYPEWLAVALGVAAAIAVLAGSGFKVEAALPAPVLWLIVFALYLALRALLGAPAYPQSPLLGAAYVLYAVLMIQLGTQLVAAHGAERVAHLLAVFLLAGALLNAVAGIIQFYGRPAWLEALVAELRGARAYGNIAQTNLYASYLALGQTALVLIWPRSRTGRALAGIGLLLLVLASALSGSRSALLYALWLAALGCMAPVRLKRVAWVVAAAVLVAHLAVPWVNGVFELGPTGAGTLERVLGTPEEPAAPRVAIFSTALRVFWAAPLAGAGWGEFAGAAFAQGLEPSLTQVGQVWTSPHNLLLHLLAETGLPGAFLVLGGLWAWGASLARRHLAQAHSALWWMIAASGVPLLHSLFEYPLWNAHFLGVTALLIGSSAAPGGRSLPIARVGGLVACMLLATALALVLRDYVRLDTARVTGTTTSMAPADQVARDARTMRELAGGLLGPVAELWIFVGAPLGREGLAEKLAMSERLARYWPANEVLVRRAVYLALDGDEGKARALLTDALRTFPQRRGATVGLLEQASATEPAAIAPLLAAARTSP